MNLMVMLLSLTIESYHYSLLFNPTAEVIPRLPAPSLLFFFFVFAPNSICWLLASSRCAFSKGGGKTNTAPFKQQILVQVHPSTQVENDELKATGPVNVTYKHWVVV